MDYPGILLQSIQTPPFDGALSLMNLGKESTFIARFVIEVFGTLVVNAHRGFVAWGPLRVQALGLGFRGLGSPRFGRTLSPKP